MSAAPHHTPTRAPWTVRVATWSARHRWPVLGLWFLATIGLFVLSTLAGGTRTQGAVSQNNSAKFESIRAYDLFGAGAAAAQPPGQSVYLVVSSTTQKLTDPAYGAAISSFVARLQALTATVDG